MPAIPPFPKLYRMSMVGITRLIFGAAILVATTAQANDAASLRQAYLALAEEFDQALNATKGDADAWRPARPASGELLFVVADQYALQPIDNEVPAPPAVQTLRETYSESLFELAQQAARDGQSSLAFQWATEVVRENPDHQAARRVLGYHSVDGNWLTTFAAKMAAKGNVWHAEFGWVSRDEVSQLIRGQRPSGSRWISAESDALRRQSISDGWQVRTDHFLVATNQSIEAGVQLAAQLERLFQVWRQLFAGFYLSDHEVQQLFEGSRHARQRSKPFRILYYRSRDEYVSELRRFQPRIAETLGIYFDNQRTAHFFAGQPEESSTHRIATLYHEAVHQLFQESRKSARHVGASANFWIIEGIATYFESLEERHDPWAGSYFTIGEPNGGRMPAARQRALAGDFLAPWEEVIRLGQSDLQHHAQIAKLYSQAAGMATFLMHAENGQFREPLVRYLRAIYTGRDKQETLTEETGCSFAELDQQYLRFLRSLP